ncbi:huntingtin-interacting protein M [Diceros bicornis minor]|uniref:Huntingtin-interacting protein M n=2 Tax=Rhinocerotidae TaxID=9803 RepID=A0A7J7EGF3_DICBM|nr:PREDICTED: huntingtin-interacting protein M-like [Ceratotherium simum simum]XP_058391184.1 huntingtin-interacting protein M-like [Diceros bicornis minor]XP_058391192.1 huntingtin-interacting protein M-like [Diceros bicornis minor]XP_058391622.1 huntingtin-interacting protein M [Diceros bicornis minor]KAF5914783.1 hypothetical protein HPG69_006270 [Diceros bicornis minor]
MAEEQNRDSSYQNPACLPTAELQFPVSYLDRLLQKDEHAQHPSSSTEDFLVAMLDCLTDYILEMVGNEATNSSSIPQDVEGGVNNNREPQRQVKDAAFTLFDKMPGGRKNG